MPSALARPTVEHSSLRVPEVGTAEHCSIELDRWLLNRARAGNWLADAWGQLLASPRWRWLRPQRLPFGAVLILLHDPAVDPTRGSDSPEATWTQLLGDREPGRSLTVYAVNTNDRALLQLASPDDDTRTGSGWEQELLAAAGTADNMTLEALLARFPWRLAGGSAELGIACARSAFREVATVHGEFAQTLLARASNFKVIPDHLHDTSAMGRERLLARRVRQELLGLLDVAAIAHLRRTGAALTGATYNFLARAGASRAWREQALAAYPAVLSALHEPTSLADDPAVPQVADSRARDLASVIDAGLPLTPWLSQRLKAPVEAVRHLKTVPVRRLARHPAFLSPNAPRLTSGDVECAVRLLGLCVRERRPTGRRAWRQFMRLVDVLAPLDRALERLPGPVAQRFRDGSLRRFLKLSERRRDTVLAGGHDGELLGVTSAVDGVDHCVESLLAQAARQGVSVDWAGEVFACLRVDELLRVNARWHEAVREFDENCLGIADAENDSGRVNWPALLPEHRAGGRQFVELTDSDHLREEGRIMRHCVGTYASRCLFSSCHVFSLRSTKGERLSTLEVSLDADGSGRFRPRIAEHRALLNRLPSEDCGSAARTFVGQIEESVNTAHFQYLDIALHERQSKRAQIEGAMHEPRAAYAFRQSAPAPLLAMTGRPLVTRLQGGDGDEHGA